MVSNILYLLLALLLVLCNAFFVAAEFGMVKLRHTRVTAIKKSYGLRGRILGQIHKHLDAYLSACQLGITLASLGLGWVGEPAFAHLLAPFFEMIGLESAELIKFISFFAAFSFISFLHIVAGELVPKSLAIRQSEKVSVWTAIPLFAFYWMMYPAIWVLNYCANYILKITKLDRTHKGENTYSYDEIKIILNTTYAHEQLSKQELDLLRHSIELLDLEAVDVMRPIEDMVSFKAEDIINDVLPKVIQYRFSRYPVFHEQTNEFVGIVHVKDILLAITQQDNQSPLKSIMRPVLKINRHLSAIKLLNKLQEGMPHFALVYSGRESPIGFVTLDNIFQVLVGRVRDEFHKIDEAWSVASDGAFIMHGNSSLYILERALKLDIELDENTEATSDTIFGLILTKLGRLPKIGEKIEFDQFTVLINNMKGHKVTEVAIYPVIKRKR